MGCVGEASSTWYRWRRPDEEGARQPSRAGDPEGKRRDNLRIKRYVSKYTINPACTNGIDDYVVRAWRWASGDLVLWDPPSGSNRTWFKGRPDRPAVMGDANASIPTEPTLMRPMFGGCGRHRRRTSLDHLHVPSRHRGRSAPEPRGLRKKIRPARGVRWLTKADMALQRLSLLGAHRRSRDLATRSGSSA